jgi:hypothetical protein
LIRASGGFAVGSYGVCESASNSSTPIHRSPNATVAELEAIFGWHGGGMASHYTREADRVRLAREAMHKLVNEKRTSIPAPLAQVRAAAPKDQ